MWSNVATASGMLLRTKPPTTPHAGDGRFNGIGFVLGEDCVAVNLGGSRDPAAGTVDPFGGRDHLYARHRG